MSALPKIPVIQRIANQGKTLEIMSVNVKVREKKTFKEEVTIFQPENNSTPTTFISRIVVTENFNEYQTQSISSINITKPNMKQNILRLQIMIYALCKRNEFMFLPGYHYFFCSWIQISLQFHFSRAYVCFKVCNFQ